ncbi:DNA repair protein RecO [Candidatus Omnitrophota bacterium]
MAIQTEDAVLLRKKDFRETSFILSFFTRNFGKVHGILKGARGSRARSTVNPLFFSLNQIVYYEKKKSDFFIISQCETQEIFLNILSDWERTSVAYYILELADVFTEPGLSSEEIFVALLNSFRFLNDNKEPSSIARLFEIKLLMSLGLWPGRETFELTKPAASSLLCFENASWEVSSKIKLARDVTDEIKKITTEIIGDNLDRPLKTVRMFG